MSDRPQGEEDPPRGRMRPTSPATMTAWAVIGLVAGRLLHPLAERVMGTAPLVSWTQPLALVLATAIVGATAWATWRSVHHDHQPLEPHQAVNRLVLARACALVGCLVAGGYLGYAVSWLGVDAELAHQRAWRSAAGALAAVALVVVAVLLERACRVPSEDEEP